MSARAITEQEHEPLVLVDGVEDDNRRWDPVVPYLKDFRVMRVEVRGVSDVARGVVDAVDNLGLAAPNVAAFSAGEAARSVALALQQRVRRLALVGPVATDAPSYLRDLKMPTLVVAGEHDVVGPLLARFFAGKPVLQEDDG